MVAKSFSADIVMLGTFSAWRAGTIQARALPFAGVLRDAGYQVAIVTTPWDEPSAAGQIDFIDSIPIINTRSTGSGTPIQAVREQCAWVEQLSPQAVHIIKPRGFGGLTAEWLLRRRQGPKIIVDADDWEGDGGWNEKGSYSIPMQRVFDWQERRLLRNADHVIAASRLLAARAKSIRGDASSVSLVVNGIDRSRLQCFSEAKATALMDTSHVILYSRFKEFPGHWLREFVRQLDDQTHHPVELLLIGDSDKHRSIAGDQRNVQVRRLGWVERDRLPGLLASAPLAIFPLSDSLISRSKQSVKLLELMSAGCVVIASNIGEVAATIGTAGVLIDGLDPAAFASSVVRLLDDRDQVASLSELARQRAVTFAIDRVAAPIPNIYAQLGVYPRG